MMLLVKLYLAALGIPLAFLWWRHHLLIKELERLQTQQGAKLEGHIERHLDNVMHWEQQLCKSNRDEKQRYEEHGERIHRLEETVMAIQTDTVSKLMQTIGEVRNELREEFEGDLEELREALPKKKNGKKKDMFTKEVP